MLLAMFQKMKLVREKNMLTLEQTQYSSKLSRIQKNIENKQKFYTSWLTRLDQQAKQMVNTATMMCQNQFASIFGGANGMWGSNTYGMLGGYTSPQQILSAMGDNASNVTIEDINKFLSGGLATNDPKYQPIAQAQAMVQQAMQMQRQYQQNMLAGYQNDVSIWVEMQKEQVEAEQDEVLGELSYQETMLELEKEQRDMRLQRITAELETYTQLVSQEAKNSAPTFGLG